jgi:two-component system response regulator
MTASQPNFSTGSKRKLADILFVEDSFADVALIKALLKINKINFSFHFLHDGDEAINLLGSDDPIVKKIDLIFVDFNLPKSNGFEVLSFVKSHEYLRDTPVIILSGSDEPKDMQKAINLGAVTYIVKPLSDGQLEKSIDQIPTLEYVQEDEQTFIYVVS